MSYIIDVSVQFPKNKTSQTDINKLLKKMWPNQSRYVDQFAKSSSVESRDLSIPLEQYEDLMGFKNRNGLFIETALNLQIANMAEILEKNQLPQDSINAIFSTSVTGMMIPSIESRLMNHFKLNSRAKRIPLFGLGCLGGVALINRAHDYLKAHPDELVIVMATELCSLTFQFQDQSVANLVGTSLFGDGAAMVLMAGENHPLKKSAKYQVLKNASFFYPDTERIMGWDIVDTGFQIVLSGDVPLIVKNNVSENLSTFLNENNLNLSNIQFYISHPGGPKVLDALNEIVKADTNPFLESYQSLKEHGNMSSVSVLDVLKRNISQNKQTQNQLGLMLAMGPAFASEFNLIKAL